MTNYLWSLYGEEKAVQMIAEAGFDAIDWSLYDANAPGSLVRKEDYRKESVFLRKTAEDCGLVINQCHAPFRFDFRNEEGKKDAFSMVCRAIEAASLMGAKTVVVHPLHFWKYPGNEEMIHRENVRYYQSLLSCARDNGILLCAENMWQWNDTRDQVIPDECSYPEEFCALIDEAGSGLLAACLDLGHAGITEKETGTSVPGFIRKLGGGRLRALHVHDCDGIKDLHTAPYTGTVDWEGVLGALSEISYEGDFTFEADPFLEKYPVEFVPSALRFLHDTGRMMMKKIRPAAGKSIHDCLPAGYRRV